MKQLNNTLLILIALASSTTPAFAKTLTSSTSTQKATAEKNAVVDAEQANTGRAVIANPGIQMLLNIVSHMPEGFYKLNKQAAAEHALINLDAFLQNSPNDMLKLSLTATAKKVVRILKSYNQAHTKRAKLAEVIRVEQGALAELALTAEELSIAQDALTKTTPLLYAAARTRNRPWGWYAAGGSAALVALLTAIAYKKGYGPKWAALKMLKSNENKTLTEHLMIDILTNKRDKDGSIEFSDETMKEMDQTIEKLIEKSENSALQTLLKQGDSAIEGLTTFLLGGSTTQPQAPNQTPASKPAPAPARQQAEQAAQDSPSTTGGWFTRNIVRALWGNAFD